MPIRARYDGPYDEVFLPDVTDEAGNPVVVKKSGFLPEDVDVAVRDNLLEQDTWTRVNQSKKKED